MTSKIRSRRMSAGILAVALTALPQLAGAAISCMGSVDEVLLYADGTLNVRGNWRNDYTFLCNTNGTWGNVPAEVCLGWYGLLAKAAADNKTVLMWYETTATCATVPTYGSSPVPIYVGLKRQ